MRLKNELYKPEQEAIIDKIVNIMELETKNNYTLNDLDKDIVKMLTKTRYRLEVKNVHLYENEEHIRTQSYTFTKI